MTFLPPDVTAEEYESGQVLRIDKPLDWTSFDVVKKIKISLKHDIGLKKIKVGHAGTLDPKATGLLIVCTGKATKSIMQIQDAEKEYEGTFKLGATTPCLDTECEETEWFDTSAITEQQIKDTAHSFIGVQEQLPPMHSALKVDGKRAYEMARKGQEVELKTRTIEIKEFEITRIEMPYVDFRIVCSKGTYIRSIARDFGKALNNGAYLTRLKRTRIGDFTLSL